MEIKYFQWPLPLWPQKSVQTLESSVCLWKGYVWSVRAELCLSVFTLSSTHLDWRSALSLETLITKQWTMSIRLPHQKKVPSCRRAGLMSEIRADNQQPQEAIECRQAPNSVKPCYPRERVGEGKSMVSLLGGHSTHTQQRTVESGDQTDWHLRRVGLAGLCLIRWAKVYF